MLPALIPLFLRRFQVSLQLHQSAPVSFVGLQLLLQVMDALQRRLQFFLLRILEPTDIVFELASSQTGQLFFFFFEQAFKLADSVLPQIVMLRC